MFAHTDDTIVAISSAAGASARAVVRLSGPDALITLKGIFEPLPETPSGFSRHFGRVFWSQDKLSLPAELYVFRAPHSYTRQDLAEIHLPGCPPVLSGLVEQLITCGARLAEPGEFTGRSFLSGAMDLTAVEGVAGMIYAGSDEQMRAAEQLLHGALSRRIRTLTMRVSDLLSLVEASIDFVEEPIEFVSRNQAVQDMTSVITEIEELLGHGVPMERLDVHYQVALVGPPNAGKSTLFNLFTGMDRSICSSIPGTTRDIITAPVNLDGTDVWLMDSAGIGSTSDPLREVTTEYSRNAAKQANLVIFVLEASSSSLPSELMALMLEVGVSRSLCVLNKMDCADASRRCGVVDCVQAMGHLPLFVSAKTGQGCDELRRRIRTFVHEQAPEGASQRILLNARHRNCLASALDSAHHARAILDENACMNDVAELVALELRETSSQLGSIIGEITTEDVLDRIFSRFCIGK